MGETILSNQITETIRRHGDRGCSCARRDGRQVLCCCGLRAAEHGPCEMGFMRSTVGRPRAGVRQNIWRVNVDEVLDVVTRAYEYQRVRPAVVGTTSGLETVQLTLEGKLPTPPIIATLGISLVEAAEGRAVFEGSPAEWQYNQLATVHGGWLSALLDSALGYAVQTALPAGRGFTTLDLHVRFVRAVTETVSRLRTEAHVTHAGNRTVTAEGRIVGPDGKVYATGTTSCLVLMTER
jgi:uncharacterized protein (TIGR00369 family)